MRPAPRSLLLSAALLAFAAGVPEARTADTLATLAGGRSAGPLALTHGGVGSGPELADGPRAAADTALKVLLAGGSSLDAATAGTVHLENDPRFNAGTGANIRLDGKTIQMDAAVMTGAGRFAAVGVIERVRNPVLVARAVMDSTPHLFLAGEGATRFAHRIGFADVVPTCPEAEAKYRARMKRLGELYARTDTTIYDWRRYWNFPNPMPADVLDWGKHGDTVGTVARDASGRFAATLSTGGTSVTLYGRVGDVPVYGCGLYAGPAGAVACTGEGEEIIKRFMAHAVYEKLAHGVSARRAVEEAVRAFPERFDLGLIAVGREGWGVAGR
ncbi:MAG: isoaspartyl peptidase/L-asparaginase [Candidatus Eisenbacteria bacterium]|nr:isoaspartyl peptidase/L-asparaginase [Candidatus Eisenbacteria bacterium]